jgi:CheY-like chemotaxis protein
MRKIIFVEDDEEDMFLFDKALNELDEDLEVFYAVCGDDLFYLLRSSFPDLIFLDLQLPGMNGLECLKQIRRIDAEGKVPIIILSVDIGPHSIDECYSAKANHYIIKPQRFENLVETLKHVLSIDWAITQFPKKEAFLLS